VQFAVSIPTLVVMFAWFVMVGIRGARSGRLSRGLARAASVVGIAGVAGLLAFAIGLALPAGSPAQWAVFIIGGVPGGIAYLGLTVWWLVLAARGR